MGFWTFVITVTVLSTFVSGQVTDQHTTTVINGGDIMANATCGAGDAHSSGTTDLSFGFCEGDIMTGATCGAGDAHSSRTSNITSGFVKVYAKGLDALQVTVKPTRNLFNSVETVERVSIPYIVKMFVKRIGHLTQFWRFVMDSLRNSGGGGRRSFSVIFNPPDTNSTGNTDTSGQQDNSVNTGIAGFFSDTDNRVNNRNGNSVNTAMSSFYFGNNRNSVTNRGRSGNEINNDVAMFPPPPPPPPAYPKPITTTVEKRPSETQNPCTAEYESITGHTLCMKDDPRVRSSGVSEEDKRFITDLHNDYRSRVEPPATDLVKLKWDERLASVAQKWANQCMAGHDKMRKIPSIGMSIGQNVAGGYKTWEEAVFYWYDEIRMWHYGVDPESYLGRGGWKKIGHFTQIVQNVTFLVGCGYADCSRSRYRRYYVCDYAAGQSNLAYPYTAAKDESGRCSKCPYTCNQGQCDCNGLVCLNGGKLNPNTCTCTCTKLYKGKSCEKLSCPAKDKWICRRDWPPAYCSRYSNVPETCPYMCGVCKGASGTTPPPEVTYVSSFGCRYEGVRSDLRECKAYGKGGQDIFACASNGGNITCRQCDQFFNVKRDMCPVMCGLCDPQCDGKRCENGGTLDTDSCTCQCRPPYEGAQCETVKCTIPDKRHCRFWPATHCTRYVNVPADCRHKCGLCQ